MAYLSFSNITRTSITVTINDLTGDVFGVSIKNNTTGQRIGGSTVTFSNLNCGTTYSFTGDYDTSTEFGSTNGSQATSPCAPPLPGSIGALSASNQTASSVTLSWATATNAASYSVFYKKTTDSTYIGYGGTSATSMTVSGLAASTNYNFKVYATNETGNGPDSFVTTATLSPPPPPPVAPNTPTVSSVTTNSANISWNSVTNANAYKVEYRVSGGAWSSFNTTSTSAPLSGLASSTVYEVKVTSLQSNGSGGYNTGGTSGVATFTTQSPPPPPPPADTTPPTVSINSHNGVNAITINWSASDNVALRSADTFGLYISGPNNNTLAFKQYVNLGTNTFTFQSDGAGNPLVVGAVYLTRVVAVDSSNNTSSADRYVTYSKSRPSNFAWTYPKVKGQSFNLTYTEWNNFLSTINEFREYKGYSRINTFTYAVKDANFTAKQFNQAVNIINSMSPPTAPPGTKVGISDVTDPKLADDILASDLNGLVTSLNSIQ